MNARCRACRVFAVSLLLVVSTAACTSRNQAQQNQSEQDQKLRQEVADDTAKAKAESERAARQLNATANKLAHKADVAAQGAKEGWNRGENQSPLDLNSASESEVESLPGMDRETAEKVIDGRPYHDTDELVTRGIVTRHEYRLIESQISVSRAASKRPMLEQR
jgi:DNA uptake protein ComE-like DNA-binding protein